MSVQETSHRDRARAAWGDDLPDWVDALARAATKTSQNAVSKQLGISASQVSLIISKSYAGKTERAEEKVRGLFMKQTLTCPVLGEIGVNVCRNWREKGETFSPTNASNVRMYRACRRCSRNQKVET